METIFVSILVACLVMLTSCESDSNNMYPKYKFQFKTGDDGDHTRAEESDTTGRVTGMYSYLDPNGILRTIRYNAAPGTGYQAYGDGILQIGSDITNSVDSNSIFSRNNETNVVDDLKSSNDTVQQDIESQTSESVATESPAAEVSSEAHNDSENESKSAPGNSSDDSSTSFNINRNRIVPLIFPYGPYHPILIRSGSVLHAIPHAFTYNLVAPRYQSIPCYHGDCNDAGICECDLCWKGNNCKEYVDNYLPEFNKEEETAIVSDPWSPEIVYTAQAFDGDQGSTCPTEAMICECAETSYSITNGDPNKLFYINNLTGEVYVKEASHVVSGKTYNLTLTAKSSRGLMSPSPNAHMLLRVVIDDLHHHLAKVLQQNMLTWLGDDEDDGTHSRSKRSTENKNYNTEFNFTLVTGEAETMETGGFLKYLLEITLPQTDGMDLTVEFFTKDIGNGNYTPVLALFNVEVLDKPDGVTFSKGDQPHIEMLLSDEIMTAYDRAIVTFGEVKNKNADPVPLYMTFSVTQIKNPNTLFETRYLVTAGAEYDKETYVWVGQSEVTVHNSTEEKRIEVDVVGPKEIPLDSAGVYVMIAHCSVRSDNFTFEVIAPEETEVVTVGNLGVKDFDVNYDPVPQSIYFYNTTKEGSDDDVIYTSAQLNLGIMTNVGNHGDPREDGNIINVTFAIYALNNETHLEKEVSFTTRVTVGREVLHSKEFQIKLVPRKDASKMIDVRSTFGDLTTPEVGIGDMAMYTLWSNLTNNGYADYVLEVDVQRYKGIPRLEACSARLWNYKDSFDVPYLNTTFIDPEIVDGKFLFRFNRIHVTGQRTPSIYNDSMMYVHLIMKVSALPVNKEGIRLTPSVRIGTQGKPQHEVKVPGLEIHKKGDYQAPAMVVENGVDWPYMYVGGAIVLNITMFVPRGQGYAEVFMEASGENNPPLPAVHICRAELSDVGRNVPCLRMHQDEVNANFTKYSKTDAKNRLKPDMTSVMLGDVGALPVEGKNFATVSVVVELPEGVTIKDDEQYPISSGLLISTNTIWSAMANYTMKKSAPPNLAEEQWPEASAHYDEEQKVVPGHLAEVEIWVDTKIQTISTVIIEVEGTTKDISLCGLKVKSFGRNLPCVDLGTEPFYHPHANPLDGNKVAGLKFSALSNVGFRSNPDHDRLVAIALVRISPSCKKATTELEWRVTYGGGKRDGKATIKVDLDADTSDMSFSAKEPKALAFKPAYPGKAITAGSPVVVDLEVSLEPGSLAPVIVEIKNMDAGKKFPYDMCLGGVWFRGRNYPCFSPVQVESNFSTSGNSGNRNDSAVYNLGLVCNTFVDSRDEENKVTIRVAMRPPDDGSLKIKEQFSVEGYATVGSHSKKIDTVKFTIAREPEQVETNVNASVKLVNPDPIPIRIHQRLWIPFNITIPIDALVKVEVEARAPYKNNRAIMTVHNMRLVSGGVNIPCPMLYPQPKVIFNPTGPTTQSDVIRGYIGYFTNLGLSHKMNMAQEGDDDLTIEIEAEMTDHPLTEHDKIFPLKFIAEVGKAVADIDQPMQVFRDGMERADLDVKVHVDNKKPYQSGERINFTVTAVHKTESTAEPINATIRLYLPPYVEFDHTVFNNATTVGTVTFITENGGLDIVIPQFLFSDSATIIVSLLADPRNERGFGRGEENATTPYRVLCLQNFREEPSANPKTPETIVNCGPVDHVMYIVNSQGNLFYVIHLDIYRRNPLID
ncbi:uncharacterized protein NPIL_540091 [Nephila pilipes]|uniref:Cadherin domain-containing protein n=2 Tax=Nephila pilipes TaxID=299642 RepID=A0A8X6PS42_NEPPI|nr:uncharacterized protein NPIL_540091 [Nephila pilipes]